jgi:putative two-component system response regulator
MVVRKADLERAALGGRGAAGHGAAILLVDDDSVVREALEETLTALGHRVVSAQSAEAALEVLEQTTPHLILTDVHMGAMSGIELCARVKADPRWQLTPVVLLTGVSDLAARVAGLAAGADDFFAKPVEMVELRTRLQALLHVTTLLDQLDRAEGVISTLGATIELRDPYTGGHCERLARYAVALGDALGLGERELRALRLGGFLHDLGKIAVPDSVLLKPGPLDAAEWAAMRRHPALGAELVGDLRTLEDVRPLIRHHHERLDGSGYPDGLRGDAIPVGVRIMAVVDVYDALRTMRPYKAEMTHDAVMRVLFEETEAGFWDPRVVTTFGRVLRDFDRTGSKGTVSI